MDKRSLVDPSALCATPARAQSEMRTFDTIENRGYLLVSEVEWTQTDIFGVRHRLALERCARWSIAEPGGCVLPKAAGGPAIKGQGW